jgi:hypothetical protein
VEEVIVTMVVKMMNEKGMILEKPKVIKVLPN